MPDTNEPYRAVFNSAECISNVGPYPVAGWKGVVKASADEFLAALAIVAFGLLMAVIAIAIKCDSPGPVLFCQERHGLNNKVIRVLKFRTMYHQRLDDGLFVQAKRNDPRVTRLGRFLRLTSLDELPQLFNVISGSMSIIGPRPHPVKLNEEFSQLIPGYHSRHRVKPGITGWAQINGWRGETDTLDKMRARVDHDLFYIDNWSLSLDARIILSTLLLGWMSKNAF